MPSARASDGEWIATGTPSISIEPASSRCAPLRHLISVDLPAPLSPSSASTSPRVDLEVDAVERRDRAEALGRAADGEHGVRLRADAIASDAHASRAALATRTRLSTQPRSTSASTASRTTTPITISW